MRFSFFLCFFITLCQTGCGRFQKCLPSLHHPRRYIIYIYNSSRSSRSNVLHTGYVSHLLHIIETQAHAHMHANHHFVSFVLGSLSFGLKIKIISRTQFENKSATAGIAHSFRWFDYWRRRLMNVKLSVCVYWYSERGQIQCLSVLGERERHNSLYTDEKKRRFLTNCPMFESHITNWCVVCYCSWWCW